MPAAINFVGTIVASIDHGRHHHHKKRNGIWNARIGKTQMPKWENGNLIRHHAKRLKKDPGCIEDVLGIATGKLSVGQYEAITHQAVRDSWAEFEAEKWDSDERDYTDSRAYFVDDKLITVITDLKRDFFITCFHEHFDSPHGIDPGPCASVGQKRLRFKKKLKTWEKSKIIRRLRRKRGV